MFPIQSLLICLAIFTVLTGGLGPLLYGVYIAVEGFRGR